MPQVIVTDTAQLIPAEGKNGNLTFQNQSDATAVFFAPRKNVTSSGANCGLKIEPGGSCTTPNRAYSFDLYVICGSGSSAELVWEVF